jgi:peptidoglycan/xylan/chitin deacetylase (PgdA/CDA1 family)
MYCERQALARLHRGRARKGGRILCYHSIGQREFGVNDVSPRMFRTQIELAQRAGYRFVSAEDIARTGGEPKDLAITFDDALKSVASEAAPILREYGIPWSVFVVSDWAEQREPWQKDLVLGWPELEQLKASGAHIGSHSRSHPDFAKIGEAQAIDELFASKKILEERLQTEISTFAIPLGQSMNWPESAKELARQAGYKIIYAQAEETRPQGTIPRTFVTRFDNPLVFTALLGGAFDRWEEWVWA